MLTTNDVIYLSGPMSGISEFNIPLFNQVAKDLRGKGFSVVNPAEHKIADGSWEDYIRMDLGLMLENCTAICVLPDWWNSKGAVVEIALACRLGMKVYDALTLEEIEIGWGIYARPVHNEDWEDS